MPVSICASDKVKLWVSRLPLLAPLMPAMAVSSTLNRSERVLAASCRVSPLAGVPWAVKDIPLNWIVWPSI